MALSRSIRVVAAAVLFVGSVATTELTSRASDPLPLSRPVAAGAAHSLAIDPSGVVWSFGQNLTGQLGTGDHLPRVIPTPVTGLTGTFVAVSAGAGHSLALRNDGAIFAWGLNLQGQLGLGHNVTQLVPVQISTLSNVVAIAAGGGHSLAVKADGSLWAFGGNLLGQIGDGSATQRRVPVRVTTLSNVIAVEAGLTHSLALRNDGKVFAWGANLGGQLGEGTATLRRRPVQVHNVIGAQSIAAGAAHSLAVTNSGGLWAWGTNLTSQLGDGTTTTRRTPVLLSGIPAIATVSAGGAHSVAITTSGTALGWGDNSSGQVGNGSTTRQSTPIAVLQPPSSIAAIAAGGAHTIALAAGDASFWTWGNNLLAQLGDATHTPRSQPSAISGPNAAWGVHPPLFSPPGGSFATAISVSLSTPTPDATIRYTLDGSDPTPSHQVFASPIQITTTTTVKARAFRSGLTSSMVSAATYTIGGTTLATPVATPPGGTYAQAQSVTLTADTGAAIRYTVDGSEPTESALLFAGAITVASTTTLRARAFKAGFTPSDILTAHYVIETTVPEGEDPPPDPVLIATPVSDILLTSFADANAFLFAGADPVQRNHTPGSIEGERMAIIRGQVLDRDGAPLQGVRVTPRDQAGVGHTVTRVDGRYDVGVNGGAAVLLDFTRNGYLRAQRFVETNWANFSTAPTVRLVALDPAVTVVSMGPQTVPATARGSIVEDDDGRRQATLVVPESGVMATIHLQDGTVLPAVSQLSIRATEYTVGPGGPEAMPGPLPTTSGYTYAVELSADEALQANAVTVTFDPPLVFYLENFLDFPVGGIVPVGYYDSIQSAWIASDNGRVVRVLGVNPEGDAELDIIGEDTAATAEELAELGVTAGERRRLATLYAPGQSLWRSPVPHFSPSDLNWPSAPTSARRPGFSRRPPQSVSNIGKNSKGGASDCSKTCGSIVENQNRVLGESVAVAGTPFSLNYRSNRSSSPAFRTVKFPVTGPDLSPSLKRVDVTIDVAGQQHRLAFPPAPGQSSSFAWDGLDAYLRPATGSQQVAVTVSNVYNTQYFAPADVPRTFGQATGPDRTIVTNGRIEHFFSDTLSFAIDSLQRGQTAVAGWDLDVYHRYDPGSQTLFLGNGDERSASASGGALAVLAGGGQIPVGVEPMQGTDASFESVHSIAASPDGRVFLSDNSGIVRLDLNGTVRRVVTRDPESEQPNALAVAPDGAVYYSSGACGAQTINRLNENSPATVIATLPAGGSCFNAPQFAIATDGAFFVAGFEVYRLGRGTAEWQSIAPIMADALTADREGGVYIGTSDRIERWAPSGTITVVAGGGGSSPALNTEIIRLFSLAATRDGHIFFGDNNCNDCGDGRIRVIGPDGSVEFYGAGGGDPFGPPIKNGDPAVGTTYFPGALAVSPHGDLFVAAGSPSGGQILRLEPILARRPNGPAFRIPSADGGVIDEFDARGAHLRTVDALTGVVLYTFERDAAGRLSGVVDRDGLRTRIERDGAGVPTAIASPFGVTTALTVSNGLLARIDAPENHSVALGYDGVGLLTSFTDANQHTSTFSYDTEGLLVTDRNAAGGEQTLSRIDHLDGWMITRSQLDGGTTSYLTEQIPDGQRRVIVAPDGTETTTVLEARGVTTTASDGTVTMTRLGPDPRFGFAVPVATNTEISTPGGRSMTILRERTAEFSNPFDPFSATTVTDSSFIFGRGESRSVFDLGARTVTNTSFAGRVTVTTLDDKGRPATGQAGSLLPTTYTYNAQGRLASQRQGDRTTTFTYDAFGYVHSATDPLNRTANFTNDALGRRTQQTFPDARLAAFGYDDAGNLTSLTPPGRPAHAMVYDEVDRLMRYTAPQVGADATATQYAFNFAGAPTLVTRADAQPVSWNYDSAGRPQTLTTPTGVTTHAYHPTTGRLQSLTSPTGSLTYSYDGRLQISETFSGAVGGEISWGYDDFFRVSAERIRGGNLITFGYDADGLLMRAGGLNYGRDEANGLLTAAGLGPIGTTFAYNDYGELLEEHTTQSTGTLYRGVYTRDDGGRLQTRTETIGGATHLDAYTYDLAGRLATVTRSGAPVAAYGYDANGNRTSVTTPVGTISATYDDQDRILTFGERNYTHAPDGEVRSWSDASGTTTLTYDVQGNLLAVQLPSGPTVEYIVDARNRRIGRKVNGTVTHGWLYQSQLRPIAELDASGAIVSRFVYGARALVPEYLIRGGTTYRLITDQLGSVRLVANASTGAIVQRLDYDAWGAVLSDTNPGFQPFGYAGGLYDPVTHLVRFGVRDYDPSLARWLSKDPSAFGGHDSNLYAYCRMDPINLIDPEGTDFWSAVASAGQAFAAGVVGSAAVMVGVTSGTMVGAAAAIGIVAYGSYLTGTAIYELVAGADAWTGAPISTEDRVDIAAGLVGGLAAGSFCSLAGPKGPVFGRARYRNGQGGYFNQGPTRFGWSWDASQGRNTFGPHGGGSQYATPPWHGWKGDNSGFLMIPGPRGPGW